MTLDQIREFTLLQDKLEREVKKTSMFAWVDPRGTMKKVMEKGTQNDQR